MRRIIIDTDPGKDDAVAILLALASPELAVVSLVPVAGNVPIAHTERNARALLALAGRPDIPVYPGCAGPLLRAPIHAKHVHGDTGLGRLVLPEPSAAAQHEHGVDHLISTLRAEPAGTITLCLLGPATNLAVALIKAPDIAGRIAEVVWMAGARSAGGNVTPTAEFNAFADPEAGKVVLASGIPLTLAPLDLTHQVRLTAPRMAQLRRIDSPAAQAIATLFDGMADPAMHDPCVIARLLRPELFAGPHIHVAMEVAGTLTAGMTVADLSGVTRQEPNATWLNQADADGFFDLLFERLRHQTPAGSLAR